MLLCQFIFEPGEYDAEFHELDASIEKYAQSLKGFVKTVRWVSLDGKLRNSIYYFEDQESLAQLARFENHIEAKKKYAKWYKGYRIEISEAKQSYGDGNLD